MSRPTSFGTLAVAFLLASVFALGGIADAAGSDSKGTPAMKISAQGTNYCVACALAKNGANAQCNIVGHQHAFKVSEAKDSLGRVIPELKGKTLHYLYNKTGKELAGGHHGMEMTVYGKLYVEEGVLDVAKITPKGEGSTSKKTK